MLPGKVYAPEDFVRILRSRIWWVLVPLALASAGTAIYARSLPNRYQAETVVLVSPQRVSEQYVRSTVPSDISDRLRAIQPVILSRTRLEQIIQEFSLYSSQIESGAFMQDVVDRMKANDVRVETVRDDSFRVRYMGEDPVTVQKVADRLANLFINLNLEDRTNMAEGTNEFLEQELATARQRLMETEQRLEGYKRAHSGELPTQLGANLAQVQGARGQMATISASLDRDQDRKLALEKELTDLRTAPGATILDTPSGTGAPIPNSTMKDLALARDGLKTLELRGYKPGHPDLEAARRRVRDLEAKLDDEVKNPAPVTPGGISTVELARQRRMADLQQQLQDLATAMSDKQKDLVRFQKQADDYQARVDATPTRESDLTELSRDYATFQSQYTSLLVKRNDSRIAANLERRQVSETFNILDPAKLPERPISPNRRQINLIGMGAGLVVGLLLVAGLEYKDNTLKSEDEVTAVLGLPVVAVVPTMESDSNHRRSVQRRVLLNVGLGGTVAGCVVVVAYALLR